MKKYLSRVLSLLLISGCFLISCESEEEYITDRDKPVKMDVVKDVEHVFVFKEEGMFAYVPTLAIDPETGFLYTSFTVRGTGTMSNCPMELCLGFSR